MSTQETGGSAKGLQRSEVRTNGWQGYEPLRAKGYRHRAKIIGPDRMRAGHLLPNVHRVIALLKRWLVGAHHGRVEPQHLQAHRDEFAFRFNRRKSRHVGKIFFRLVQHGVHTAPVAYWELVAPPKLRKHKP